MKIELTLPIPPLLNRLYRVSGKRLYKSKLDNRFRADVFYLAHEAKIKPTDKKLELFLYWFREANRGDIDSILKSLLDALEGILYLNDKQVQKITVEKLLDKNNPRVELVAFEYKNL